MSRRGRRRIRKTPAWYVRKLSIPVILAGLALPISSAQVNADAKPTPTPSPSSSVAALSVSNYLNDRLHQTSASRARKVTSLTRQIKIVKQSIRQVRVDGAKLLTIAARYKGVPYVRGGSTPRGFDCSGYTKYVFAQLGIDLPRVAQDQLLWTTRITAKQARPGDLAFYMTGNYAYHVAIYAGNGMIWHSPHPGTSVSKVRISHDNMAYGRIPAKALTPGLLARLHKLEVQLRHVAKAPTR